MKKEDERERDYWLENDPGFKPEFAKQLAEIENIVNSRGNLILAQEKLLELANEVYISIQNSNAFVLGLPIIEQSEFYRKIAHLNLKISVRVNAQKNP